MIGEFFEWVASKPLATLGDGPPSKATHKNVNVDSETGSQCLGCGLWYKHRIKDHQTSPTAPARCKPVYAPLEKS